MEHPSFYLNWNGRRIVAGISAALQDADYLLIVLSKNSVQSPWVQNELNAALMDATSEQGIVILPALIDDCNIPILLEDRIYADFRTSFDDGINSLLRVFEQETLSAQSSEPVHQAAFAASNCKSKLATLKLADLRRRMSKRMSRDEVGVVWFDVFNTQMDDDMRGRTLVECVIELLDRCQKKGKLAEVIESLCADRPDLANDGERPTA
jgi:hypothetical protein